MTQVPAVLPSIERYRGAKVACQTPPWGWCSEPAVYLVRWGGGRYGTSECRREMCVTHGERWARKRKLALPAEASA